MFELTTYTELEIAHRLTGAYTKKCLGLHGHRYEVEITVASNNGSLNKDGMVVDFKKLKEIVKDVLDERWDHGACFNAADPLVPALRNDIETKRLHIINANPTLEWMVENWAKDLQEAFDANGLDLVLVRLKASETAKNTVTWTPEAKKACDTPEARGEKAVPRFGRLKEEKERGGNVIRGLAWDLHKETGYPYTACLRALESSSCDVEAAMEKLPGMCPGVRRNSPLAPMAECEASEPHRAACPITDPSAEEDLKCDPLEPDEAAYLVSYWSMKMNRPATITVATPVRGPGLVRAMRTILEERHPGAIMLGFTRIPA